MQYIILIVVLGLFVHATYMLVDHFKGFGYTVKYKVKDLSQQQKKDIVTNIIEDLSQQTNMKKPKYMIGSIKGQEDGTIGLFDPASETIFIDTDGMSDQPILQLFTTTAHEFKHYYDWNKLRIKSKSLNKAIDFWNENTDYFETLATKYGNNNGFRIYDQWVRTKPQISI